MKTRKTKIKMKKKVRKFTKNDISEPLGELKHLAHISTRYFIVFYQVPTERLQNVIVHDIRDLSERSIATNFRTDFQPSRIWIPDTSDRPPRTPGLHIRLTLNIKSNNFSILVAIVLVIYLPTWAKRYLILTAWTKVGKRCYTNQQLIKLKNRQVRYCWDFVFVFHIENRFFVQVWLVYRPHGHCARSQADWKERFSNLFCTLDWLIWCFSKLRF